MNTLSARIDDVIPVIAEVEESDSVEVSIGDFLGFQLKSNYTFNQGVASDHWIIKHGLNKYCSVVVVDSSYRIVYPEIIYKDLNTIEVISQGAFSGKAFCN